MDPDSDDVDNDEDSIEDADAACAEPDPDAVLGGGVGGSLVAATVTQSSWMVGFETHFGAL
jgi:hypothetical protein